MNSVRQNTTLCNGSLLKFNMKTKNPVRTLDVHYPRFASVLSCSLSRLKRGRSRSHKTRKTQSFTESLTLTGFFVFYIYLMNQPIHTTALYTTST